MLAREAHDLLIAVVEIDFLFSLAAGVVDADSEHY